MAPPLLLRRRRPRPPCARDRSSRGDRRPRRQLDRDPRLRHRRAGGPLRAIPRARRATGEPSRRPRARRAHSGAGRGATGPALRRRAHARDASGDGPSRWRPRTAATARTSPKSSPKARTASHERPRSSRRCPSTRSRSTTPFGCSRCRERSRARSGEEIVVANGRYGPFVKQGAETRSLESEEQLLTLTVEQAEALLAQPKQRRGRGAPKAPLKELGPDPAEREANRGQGRALRPVRHGRRDEREPAPWRHARGDHARASGRAARRKTR